MLAWYHSFCNDVIRNISGPRYEIEGMAESAGEDIEEAHGSSGGMRETALTYRKRADKPSCDAWGICSLDELNDDISSVFDRWATDW